MHDRHLSMLVNPFHTPGCHQQAGRQQRAPILLNDMRIDHEVGIAELILDGDEHHPFCRAVPGRCRISTSPGSRMLWPCRAIRNHRVSLRPRSPPPRRALPWASKRSAWARAAASSASEAGIRSGSGIEAWSMGTLRGGRHAGISSLFVLVWGGPSGAPTFVPAQPQWLLQVPIPRAPRPRQGCSTLWDAEEVDQSGEAADGGAVSVLVE